MTARRFIFPSILILQLSQSSRLEESHISLYGALSNPYICEDLQSHLELPPLDLAPTSFDYLKPSTITQSASQSELPVSWTVFEPYLLHTKQYCISNKKLNYW